MFGRQTLLIEIMHDLAMTQCDDPYILRNNNRLMLDKRLGITTPMYFIHEFILRVTSYRDTFIFCVLSYYYSHNSSFFNSPTEINLLQSLSNGIEFIIHASNSYLFSHIKQYFYCMNTNLQFLS